MTIARQKNEGLPDSLVWWSKHFDELRKPKTYSARAVGRFQVWRDVRRSANYPPSLFIKIPKNAGTSVYRMLQEHGLVKLNTPKLVQRYFRNSGRVTFGHMSIGSLMERNLVSRAFVDSAFKFAIGRDPYARAASLYRVHSKLFENWHHRPSFAEFLRLVADGYYERLGFFNWHGWSQCNPQVEWLRDAWPDKIYNSEKLDEFVVDISERWQIPQPDLLHINRSTADEQLNMSREEKSLIEKIYAEDFDVFGYSKR